MSSRCCATMRAMSFIYSRMTAGPERAIIVFLQHQANVFLMEEAEFENYRFGSLFRCRGGWCRRAPVRLAIPSQAKWCVVVDLAGQDLDISAYVEVVTLREANAMDWSAVARDVPLPEGFRLAAHGYVSRAIWIIDPVDEPEPIIEAEAEAAP